MLVTSFSLVLKIVLLGYDVRQSIDVNRQDTLLYIGSCKTVSVAISVAHIGINLLVTPLVLAASATCHYLTAPI